MDFIEIYDNALSENECERLLEIFESSQFKTKSFVLNQIIDSKKKEGTDLTLDFNCNLTSHDFESREILLPKIIKYLSLYKEKYPLLANLTTWQLESYYHIQKFSPGEGYYAIHCEHESSSANRIIVWLLYLNDASSGTKFYHQDLTLEAKRGRLVFWPAGWTHMHSGVIPNIDDKYIASGWFSFTNK